MVVKKPKNSGSKPKDTVKGSASDSQFQSLIETAIDIVAVLNEDGTIRYLSPSVQRITGYSPEELIGQSAFVHMHEEDVDEQLEVFKATVSNPDQATQGLPHSFRFKHKDGHWVVLESVSNKLPSGLEAPGIVVNARDVTERTQALESMRETAESERRLSEEHEIIAEIGRIISSDLNLKDVFELFAAEVSRLITFDMIAASVVDNLNQTTTINYCSGPEEYIEDFQATVPLSGSFTGQVVSSGKPVIIQGSAAHEHGLEGIIHPVGTDHHGKVLSRLGLPMTNRGEVIGALIFFSSQPEAFSELDVAMAERVCYQIAGAINNATLFDDLKITEAELASTAEERGKVASQNEVIAEIGRIVSSTLNIDEVYEPFADQVHKLIDYDVFGIAVVDMEKEQFRVAHRVGDNLLGKTIGSQLPFEGTIIGEVVRSGKAKIVQGVSKGYLQENYPVIVSTYESGVRSWLCVPLINRGTFVGTVLVHSRQENAFKDSDIELVERVCNQIAGAIASAGLFDDLKTTETQLAGSVAERTKVATQNEVIAEIGRIISSTLDIDEIYEPFAEQVRKLIDYDVLAVGVVHEVGRTIRLAHRFGDNLLGKTVGEIIPFKGTLTGEVEKTKQPIIFQGTPRAKLHERFPEAIPTFESGVRSWLCIPLVNRTEFVGTLLVLSKSENAFDEHDVELAQRVGNQIAGAIDSVRLFAGIKAVEADLAISVEERTEAATQNEVIAEIGRIIGSALNIEEVYEPFTIQVRKLIHYDILGIGVFEPDGKSSRIAHRVGDDLIGKQIGEAIPFEGSVSGGAAKVKHAIIVQGISREDLLKNYP
ncbi:MAG: GAF domain-containing protein, partial [Chloroflexi bacterium]|nr:GAF domain-containing protein [Chloroflexota bacterium]